LSDLFLHSNFHYLGQSGRRGKITWNKITETPHEFINSKFLLDTPFGDPTRINIADVEVYWNDWVARDIKGEPFHFLSAKGKKKATVEELEQEEQEEDEGQHKSKGKGKGKEVVESEEDQDQEDQEDQDQEDQDQEDQDQEDQDQDQEEDQEDQEEESPLPGPSSDFNIDYGISLPCECNTPALRTSCLQQLVSQEGKGCILFHQLVSLVDTLEVSFASAIYSSLYLTSF
jgi:hypothetical protein